jgi:hypothetical protein
MENEVRIVNGYVQNSEGKWVLTEEAKAESLALYYSGRLAYNREDTRHAIGRYNAVGEVIPFKPWPTKSVNTEE